VALGLLGSAVPLAAAATDFHVTAGGMSAYVIAGVNNPTLTLTRGQTYTFTVDLQASGHPFWITTARGAGDAEANAFTLGVTNNGASPGTVTFVVPTSAPATLFYQCSFHDPMGGTLTIISPAAGVPSAGPVASAALAGILFLSAVVILRRRRQNAIAAIRAHDQ
jgi:hypothetical protein